MQGMTHGRIVLAVGLFSVTAIDEIGDLFLASVDLQKLAILHLKHAVHKRTHTQVVCHHDPCPVLLVNEPGGNRTWGQAIKSRALYPQAPCWSLRRHIL